MTQKVVINKCCSSVTSVLDDGHTDGRDMVGEMEGMHGSDTMGSHSTRLN